MKNMKNFFKNLFTKTNMIIFFVLLFSILGPMLLIDPFISIKTKFISNIIKMRFKERISKEEFIRANFDQLSPFYKFNITEETEIDIENFTLNRKNYNISLTFYKKKNNHQVPLLLWFHSGFYVLGSNYGDYEICKNFSQNNFFVIQVHYSLSPENKFPYAINEGVELLKWIKEKPIQGLNYEEINLMGKFTNITNRSRIRFQFGFSLVNVEFPKEISGVAD
jgi:acetyl esterase/lipase